MAENAKAVLERKIKNCNAEQEYELKPEYCVTPGQPAPQPEQQLSM